MEFKLLLVFAIISLGLCFGMKLKSDFNLKNIYLKVKTKLDLQSKLQISNGEKYNGYLRKADNDQ